MDNFTTTRRRFGTSSLLASIIFGFGLSLSRLRWLKRKLCWL